MRIQATTVAILTAALALTTAGCDKLTATTFAAAMITRTPDLATAQGMDSGLATALGTTTIPDVTVGLVGVGERDSITSTSAPKPVTGATVTMTFDTPAQTVSLCETGADGSYQTTSETGAPCASTISYVVDSTYQTKIETSKDTYTLSVKAPDHLDASYVDFVPALAAYNVGPLSLLEHQATDTLAVSWPNAPGAAGKNVFVTVFRINFAGDFTQYSSVTTASNWTVDSGNPVYTNAPETATAMLDMLTGTPATSVTIPTSAFSAKGLYMVMVTLTELGTNTSDNLSIGSGSVAGWGTGFVFIVQ